MDEYNEFPVPEKRLLRRVSSVPISATEEDINRLHDMLSDSNEDKTIVVIDALRSVAVSESDVDTDATSIILDAIDKYPNIQYLLANAIQAIAIEKPDILKDDVDALYGLIYESSDHDEEGEIRPATVALQKVLSANPEIGTKSEEILLRILKEVPLEDRNSSLKDIITYSNDDVVADTIEIIVSRLEDSDCDDRISAIQNLGWIGEENPELVESHLETLCSQINAEEDSVRIATLKAIKNISESHPDFWTDKTDVLVDCMFDDNDEVRTLIFNLIEISAEDCPGSLRNMTHPMVIKTDPIQEPQDTVRGAAAQALSTLTENLADIADPDSIGREIEENYSADDIDDVRVPIAKSLKNILKKTNINLVYNQIRMFLNDDNLQIQKVGWTLCSQVDLSSIGTSEIDELITVFPSGGQVEVTLSALDAIDRILSEKEDLDSAPIISQLIEVTVDPSREVVEKALSIIVDSTADDPDILSEVPSDTLKSLDRHFDSGEDIESKAVTIFTRVITANPTEFTDTSYLIDLVNRLSQSAENGDSEATEALCRIGIERPQIISDEAMDILSSVIPEQLESLLNESTTAHRISSIQLLGEISTVADDIPDEAINALLEIGIHDEVEVQREAMLALKSIADNSPELITDTEPSVASVLSELIHHDDKVVRVSAIEITQTLFKTDYDPSDDSITLIIEGLESALDTDRTKIKTSAMIALVVGIEHGLSPINTDSVLNTIFDELENEAPRIRFGATKSILLALRGTDDIDEILDARLEPLIDRLSDSNLSVRSIAHGVFSESTDQLYESCERTDVDFVPELLASVDDPEAKIRELSVKTLAQIENKYHSIEKGPSTIKEGLLDPVEDVRNQASSYLKKVVWRDPGRLQDIVPSLVDMIGTGPEVADGLILDILAQISNKNPSVMKDHIQSLTEINATTKDQNQYLLELYENVGSEFPDSLENEVASELLYDKIINNTNTEIRKQSASVLGVMAQSDATTINSLLNRMIESITQEQDADEKRIRTVEALGIIGGYSEEAAHMIVELDGVQNLTQLLKTQNQKPSYERNNDLARQVVIALGSIQSPHDDLYKLLIEASRYSGLGMEVITAIADIAAEHPDWVESRDVVDDLLSTANESKYRKNEIKSHAINKFSQIGIHCSDNVDLDKIVNICFDSLGGDIRELSEVAAATLESLYQETSTAITISKGRIVELSTGLEQTRPRKTRVSTAKAVNAVAETYPSLIVDTRIVPKLIACLDDSEKYTVEAIRAIGQLGRSKPKAVQHAVKPLADKVGQENYSNPIWAGHCRVSSIKALVQIALGSPTIVSDIHHKIFDYLSHDLVTVQVFASLIIILADQSPNISVEEETVERSFELLKQITEPEFIRTEAVLDVLQEIHDEDDSVLAPIQDTLKELSEKEGPIGEQANRLVA